MNAEQFLQQQDIQKEVGHTSQNSGAWKTFNDVCVCFLQLKLYTFYVYTLLMGKIPAPWYVWWIMFHQSNSKRKFAFRTSYIAKGERDESWFGGLDVLCNVYVIAM